MQSPSQPRLAYLAAAFRHALKPGRNSRPRVDTKYFAEVSDIDRECSVRFPTHGRF